MTHVNDEVVNDAMESFANDELVDERFRSHEILCNVEVIEPRAGTSGGIVASARNVSVVVGVVYSVITTKKKPNMFRSGRCVPPQRRVRWVARRCRTAGRGAFAFPSAVLWAGMHGFFFWGTRTSKKKTNMEARASTWTPLWSSRVLVVERSEGDPSAPPVPSDQMTSTLDVHSVPNE